MAETEITFHNNAAIRVQAQIYTGRTLVGTCVAGPGEIGTIPSEQVPFDMFFKDGATGWELARKLGSAAHSFTLSRVNGRYVIS